MSTMSTMVSFSPLPNDGSTVRLLAVKPGNFNDAIEGTLFHAPLACSTRYEALSYTWGSARVMNLITINSSPVAVTVNLASALRYLRDPVEPRTLWIDALCLNQDDDDEKAAQIPLMHLVYRRAFRVLVWLGPPSTDSTLAFAHMRDLHSLLVDPARCPEVHYTIDHKNWPLVLYPIAPYSRLEEESKLAFYRLLARPWWQRAWITQEVLCGRDVLVQCGGDSISWEWLQMAMTIFRDTHLAIMETGVEAKGSGEESCLSTPRWPADVGNNALSLGWDRERLLSNQTGLGIFQKGTRQITAQTSQDVEQSTTNLSWVLLINRGRKCRFAHDRIFSVLGLAGAKFSAQLRQDYRESVERLYCSTVENYARATGGCLDIIMQSQHSVWQSPQLQHMHPSWAADWKHILRSAPFHQNDHAQIPWDKFIGLASQPDTPHYVFSPSKLQLAINSHALGSLEAVALEIDHLLEPGHPFYAGDQTKLCRPSSDAAPPFRARSWWEFRRGAEVAALLEPLRRRIPAGHTLWKRFLDAWLCAVAWRLRIPKTRRWVPNKACDWTVEDWPLVAAEKRFIEVEEVASAVDYIVSSRTLGMLQDGRLVLAPDFAEEGDSVHVLAGCSNAAVLRRRKDGCIMFLGDCYVYGLEDVLAEDAALSWDKVLIY